MTVINDYIPAFNIVDIVVALIAGAAAPHVARHVALRNACLVDAPVNKTGAIKHVRSFSAANVATADFAPRNADKPVDTCACAFTGIGIRIGIGIGIGRLGRGIASAAAAAVRYRGGGAHRIIGTKRSWYAFRLCRQR